MRALALLAVSAMLFAAGCAKKDDNADMNNTPSAPADTAPTPAPAEPTPSPTPSDTPPADAPTDAPSEPTPPPPAQ
jgi:hypothetical protein